MDRMTWPKHGNHWKTAKCQVPTWKQSDRPYFTPSLPCSPIFNLFVLNSTKDSTTDSTSSSYIQRPLIVLFLFLLMFSLFISIVLFVIFSSLFYCALWNCNAAWLQADLIVNRAGGKWRIMDRMSWPEQGNHWKTAKYKSFPIITLNLLDLTLFVIFLLIFAWSYFVLHCMCSVCKWISGDLRPLPCISLSERQRIVPWIRTS